jgi:hypothetical protein
MRLAVCLAVLGGVLAACGAPLPATLEFVDVTPAQPRLGEITTLRFRAIDSRGQPQPGVTMTFEVQGPGTDVSLNPTEATTDETGGVASTQVVATGGRVSSVVVVARVGDKTATSPALTFAGSSSTSRQFTFQCGNISGAGSGGVHAIGAYDNTRNLIAGVKVNCVAHVADRNGDGIPGAQVSFLTEAGTIGPSSVSTTDVVGNAQVLYKTSLPLPVDVEPGEFTWNPLNDATHTGEFLAPLWMHPFEWIEDPVANFGANATFKEPRRTDPIRRDTKGVALKNNPRDNLVSMIAITSGEEAYDDLNNNGVHDATEPYVDLTEPFVDNNDNGTWDPGERYVDGNANGQWDGKNGQFDPVTLIWVQERILWTSWPHPDDVSGPASRNPQPVMKAILPTGGVYNNAPRFFSVEAAFVISDPWFNTIARNEGGDGCKNGAVGPIIVEPLTGGRAFTYPAAEVQRYVIRDQRDPGSDPPVYPANVVKWSARAQCTFTASPIEGHKVVVDAPSVTGDFAN